MVRLPHGRYRRRDLSRRRTGLGIYGGENQQHGENDVPCDARPLFLLLPGCCGTFAGGRAFKSLTTAAASWPILWAEIVIDQWFHRLMSSRVPCGRIYSSDGQMLMMLLEAKIGLKYRPGIVTPSLSNTAIASLIVGVSAAISKIPLLARSYFLKNFWND